MLVTVDLPTTGEPSGALVLPYAVDGDVHSAAGSNQGGTEGPDGDVAGSAGVASVFTDNGTTFRWESRLVLTDATTGQPAFAVHAPSGSSIALAGHHTNPVRHSRVLSTVTPEGAQPSRGLLHRRTCQVLTGPEPTSGDPAAPLPYFIARD